MNFATLQQTQPALSVWWTINIRHITVSHLLKAHPPETNLPAYDVMATDIYRVISLKKSKEFRAPTTFLKIEENSLEPLTHQPACSVKYSSESWSDRSC